jgi:Transposase DDE domain group 1
MTDDTLPAFPFPAVSRKKITAAFDGGRLSSDGGVMLLAQAERQLGIAERLACFIPDRRNPERVKHAIPDMIRARIFAIACGYEDCNDFGPLRSDPAFKLACGRLPETGADLASQPTLSRLENAPTIRDAIRLSYALVDQWMASYATVPDGVVLDIDDTCDVVHGHQQLSLFHAHYDERCFLPIHVYDSATGRPVAIVLRPGKTPSGIEVRAHLRRLVRRIRTRWPATRITIRGDSLYGRAGRRHASPSGATAITPAPRPWRSASITVSTIYLGWRGPGRSPPKFRMWRMRCAPKERWRIARSFAALPRRHTGLGAGRASAASSPASRPPTSGSTSALSLPI